MSNEEFQKLVLSELKSIKTEIKEVKEIVLRTEEQTKDNTEFIYAIKEISKK